MTLSDEKIKQAKQKIMKLRDLTIGSFLDQNLRFVKESETQTNDSRNNFIIRS